MKFANAWTSRRMGWLVAISLSVGTAQAGPTTTHPLPEPTPRPEGLPSPTEVSPTPIVPIEIPFPGSIARHLDGVDVTPVADVAALPAVAPTHANPDLDEVAAAVTRASARSSTHQMGDAETMATLTQYPIPEPASVVLLITGVIGLAARRTLRRLTA